jgi:Cof subfamily protein (haloacid dehalogenase superfamily)
LVIENRIKPTLIALDLDGTLMGKERIISPRVRRAVHQVMDQGCLVTIATGRGFASAAPYARDLGVNAPLICYQGALIRDHRDGVTVHTATIPLSVARDLIAFSEARRLNFQVYTEDDQAYASRMDPITARIAELSGIPVTPVKDLANWLSRPPIKVLFFEQEEAVPGLVQHLQARFDGHLHIVRSWDRLIEATGPNVSKGEALARLATHLGIAQLATLAIGDQDNDVSMIAWAGTGVAMGDASPAAKAVADVIAPALEDEGAAWALERYVLRGWADGEGHTEDASRTG